MNPRLPIICIALILAALGHAETIEVRVLKTSKPIAAAIRSNLDDGKIPAEHFEATCDKLASQKKIAEIARFLNPTAASDLIKFETTGSAIEWKTFVEFTPTFADEACHSGFAVNLLLPGAKNDEAPTFESAASGLFSYETWQILCEFSHLEERLICLAKFSKTAPQASQNNLHPLSSESYLIPMTEMEAANTAKLANAELEAFVSKMLSGNRPFEYFRHTLSSGQSGMASKTRSTKHGFKLADPIWITSTAKATLSPDAKWVHVLWDASIDELNTTSNLPIYGHFSEDTVLTGSWMAIPAQRHPSGNSSLLLSRITIRPTASSAESKPSELKPLPDSGVLTRSYPDIHPKILRNLGSPRQLPLKDALLASGIPDGSWSAIMTLNQVIITNADVSIHKRIEALLKEFTWTAEIQRKSAASR